MQAAYRIDPAGGRRCLVTRAHSQTTPYARLAVRWHSVGCRIGRQTQRRFRMRKPIPFDRVFRIDVAPLDDDPGDST